MNVSKLLDPALPCVGLDTILIMEDNFLIAVIVNKDTNVTTFLSSNEKIYFRSMWHLLSTQLFVETKNEQNIPGVSPDNSKAKE